MERRGENGQTTNNYIRYSPFPVPHLSKCAHTGAGFSYCGMQVMGKGNWLKLHRRLLDSSVWHNSSSAHKVVFITILMRTNYEPYPWYDNDSGQDVTYPPGSFTTSTRKLARTAEVSVGAVRNALKRLEKQGVIEVTTHTGYTLIQVCHWRYYQSEPENNTDPTREVTREVTRKEEVKECKKTSTTDADDALRKALEKGGNGGNGTEDDGNGTEEDSTDRTPLKEIVKYWNEEFAEPFDLPRRLYPGALEDNIRKKWRLFREYSETGDPWDMFEKIRDKVAENPFLRDGTGGSGNWKGVTFPALFKNVDMWQNIVSGYYDQNDDDEEPTGWDREFI